MSFRRVGLIAALAQLVLMTAYVVLEAGNGKGFGYGLVGFVGILVFPAVTTYVASLDLSKTIAFAPSSAAS